MPDEKKEDQKSESKSQNGYSEDEVRKESSKAAKQAKAAQDKATELMQAAAAAGDPDERQKLLEEALEQQIQSKSLGKTAKYLRSGTFQGMAVGAGLGIAPGASLGAITGTLVGGVSSTALGGIGAGLGAATGWMHGPFWDMPDIAKGGGKLMQKITGNLPGWKATEQQKKQLEKMVGQINEQDTPSMQELESMGEDAGGLSGDQEKVVNDVKAKMPSMPSAGGSNESAKDENKEEKSKTEGSATSETGEKERKKPRKLQPKTEDSSPSSEEPGGAKKKPRNRDVEHRSGYGDMQAHREAEGMKEHIVQMIPEGQIDEKMATELLKPLHQKREYTTKYLATHPNYTGKQPEMTTFEQAEKLRRKKDKEQLRWVEDYDAGRIDENGDRLVPDSPEDGSRAAVTRRRPRSLSRSKSMRVQVVVLSTARQPPHKRKRKEPRKVINPDPLPGSRTHVQYSYNQLVAVGRWHQIFTPGGKEEVCEAIIEDDYNVNKGLPRNHTKYKKFMTECPEELRAPGIRGPFEVENKEEDEDEEGEEGE